MATDITSYTTNEEVQDIYEYYTNSDGSVNYDAIAEAIQAGDDSHFDIEDLIAAYVQGTGQLPEFMMMLVGSPEDYPWLWTEEVVGNLEQLGDLYGNNDGTYNEGDLASIMNWLTWGSSDDVPTDPEDMTLLEQAADELSGYGSSDPSGTASALANEMSLSDSLSLFMSMGNPGLALLLYVAYSLAPQMQQVQEAALDVMQDSSDQMEEILDDMSNINPESLSAQYESQALSQKMGVVSTVLQEMGQFLQNTQDALDQVISLSSDLSAKTSRTIEGQTQNI